MGHRAGGEIFKLDLGASRPLVVTHPDHVQQVLQRDSQNYLRDGVFWRPLHSLFGDGLLGEGEMWEASKKVLQPVFTTRTVNALSDRMAEAINEAVDALAPAAESGRPIHVLPEMSRIVNESVIKLLFGDKISAALIERIGPAVDEVATAIVYRFLLPFVPPAIPLPGDRAYKAAVQVIDDVLYELIENHREDPGPGHGIFAALCRARTAEGSGLTDRWVRDNLVTMFATSTETTIVALTWLWPLLDAHQEVAARLCEEIRGVVGGDRVRVEHLRGLNYTKLVVQEVLRLFPAGWIFPRVASRPGDLGGVAIKAGQHILISPFLTHRLESVWERPLEFDPERFTPERSAHRHRYAYFPFGGGPHQCIGRHVFNVEAQLILAGILSRFGPELLTSGRIEPRIGATLRPSQNLMMTLSRVESSQ